MSTLIHTADTNSALRAFEQARTHKTVSHSTYAAVVASSQQRDSESETASSLGCDDNGISPFKPSAPIQAAVSPKTSSTATTIKPHELSRGELVEVLALAMAYLPLKDINVARAAAPVLADAAAYVAPQPLGRTDITFVRWQPTEVPHPLLRAPALRRAVPGAPSNFTWRCLACGHLTYGPRSCGVCNAPINGASCRVFLGQLRKDVTAELTTYMLRTVAPEVNILHVESHTNPTDGRGRGCAWVYVDSVEDALRVTDLHKRVFADVDGTGYEGFWFIENSQLVPALCRMADTLCAYRRPNVLPRQPMVAELPAKSLLANIVSDTNNAALLQQ